jgi:hypothetical protein
MMGYSRDSFYRFKEFYDKAANWPCRKFQPQESGVEEPRAAGDRGCHRTLAIEQPALGQVCVANELRQHGLTVSPRDGTVGRSDATERSLPTSLGHGSRSSDEASVRGLHQGQQSIPTA